MPTVTETWAKPRSTHKHQAINRMVDTAAVTQGRTVQYENV
jgi:hypothetical protein